MKPRGPMIGAAIASTQPKPQALGSKIGYDPTQPLDRTKATPAQQPQIQQGKAEARAMFDTYFTKAGRTEIIYNGDRQWARITLTLETAGPVSVGNAQQLTPVLSGKGILLQTNVPVAFTIAKGTRLYIAATGVNRVKRMVEPVPWLEQITGLLTGIFGK